MIFENIEDKSKKDQKLSVLERTVIAGISGIAKIVLWKARRAKTYGDLQKLGKYLNTKMDFLEEKYPNRVISTEAHINDALCEMEEAKTEIQKL